MIRTRLFAALAAVSLAAGAHAATITITALDVRANGVFGHPDVSAVTVNGNAPAGTVVADTIDVQMTYSNLDLDGDLSANDEVTFTLRYSADPSAGQRIFNQGADTGFGTLDGVTVSMLSVSGVTTDLGTPIEFDGFTGAAIGVGGGGDVDRNADINGTNVALALPDQTGFTFLVGAVDFAPTPTVLFDNSGGTIGSVVARHFDLQFSATVIPEPTSAVLMALAACGLIRRRV